jgi:hypothetical protein
MTIAVKSSEPVPRGALVDAQGNPTRVLLNYLNGRSSQLGKVISGIATLEDAIQVVETLAETNEGKLAGQYSVNIDINGRVTSIKLFDDGTTTGFQIDAEKIYFGPQTVFDTATETFITEVGTIRSRYGTAFGASSNLIRWDGPVAVAQGSETPTNGYLAITTSGAIYHNTAALGWGATAAEAAASNAVPRAEAQRPNLLPAEYWLPKEGDDALHELSGAGSFGGTGLSHPYMPDEDRLKVNMNGSNADLYWHFIPSPSGNSNLLLPPGRYGLKVHFDYAEVGGPALVDFKARLATAAGATTGNILSLGSAGGLVEGVFDLTSATASNLRLFFQFQMASASALPVAYIYRVQLEALPDTASGPGDWAPNHPRLGTVTDGADVTGDNTASAIDGQGLLALGNFYEQASDPGSVANGSFWSKTGSKELFIRSASTWKKIANIGADLSISLSPTSFVGSPIAPPACTATGAGGSGGYTYAWTKVSGDTLTVSAPSSASTNFTGGSGGDYSIYRCTVTDSLSATAYQDFTIALI